MHPQTTPETVASDYAATARTRLRRAWQNVLDRRAPGLEARHDDSASNHLQAATIWFHLQQILDENIAIRENRLAERREGLPARSGGFAQVIAQAAPDQQAQMAQLLADKRLMIGPTITAHPTEAKRVSVLEIHRRIYRTLVDLETQRWSPREEAHLEEQLEMEIDLLWLTGELRLERPTLDAEIDWGLQFYRNSLFAAVPRLFEAFNDATPTLPADCFDLRFHSWIGGDRDGNPNVTADVTERALTKARSVIRAEYLADLDEVIRRASVSERRIALPHARRQRLLEIVKARADDPLAVEARNPNEIFRQACVAIRQGIEGQTYALLKDFLDDLQAVENGLREIKADLLADRLIRPLRWKAKVFGFRTHTLDIRQNSDVVTRTLASVWGDGPAHGTPEWSARLRRELTGELGPIAPPTEEAAELLALFKVILKVATGPDPDAIGPFILSMTRSADDILAVYLLARYAGFGAEQLPLKVVPLLETIEDLQAAPAILRETLSVSVARRSLKTPNGRMEIMLGYSDSNKDGGYFCSSWTLDQGQRQIARVLAEFDLTPLFFHGRGGSVSRGGAPTARAIAAQPVGTLGGALRTTEQGEVVTAKYANVGTAAAQLELLAASVLRSSAGPNAIAVDTEIDEAMTALSSLSQTAYTKLVGHPGFVAYFNAASPVDELALLKIGSRPARRFGAQTLDDLRAIPWVFAWSQNRHMITGWYGVGSALAKFSKIRGPAGDALLARMFTAAPLFRLIIDEVEKSLYLADMEIAKNYAALCLNTTIRQEVFGQIAAEHALTCKMIHQLTGRPLADRFPNFQARTARNAKALAYAHGLQVRLLHRARTTDDNVRVPLMQSMNTISAGLGWTG